MPRRADVVVSEILDTELIGEGVLGTMRHMHDHLAEPGAAVIPAAAAVHAYVPRDSCLGAFLRPCLAHMLATHNISKFACAASFVSANNVRCTMLLAHRHADGGVHCI